MRLIDELSVRYNQQKRKLDGFDVNNLNGKDLKQVNEFTDEIKKVKAEMKKVTDEMKAYGDDPSNSEYFAFDTDGYCMTLPKTGENYSADIKNMSDEEINARFSPYNASLPTDGRDPKINKKNNLQILNSANIEKVYSNDSGLDFGKYVKGALTGNWSNAEPERKYYAALSTTTGGVIVPDVLSAQILKKIMNKSLIYKSGVPVVDMKSNNLSIAKVKNNPTGEFKAELAEATLSDAEFEAVELKSKTLYSLCKISLEMLHSATNLSEVLQNAMADAVADAIDKACIYGVDENGIKGLATYNTINTLTADAINYAQFVNAIGKIKKANGNPTVMGINADTDTTLNLLTDTTGQPLNAPRVVDSLNRVVSNNLRNDLGVATDESEALVYDPNSIILGQQVGFKFETSRSFGMNDGSVYLRIYTMLDMAVLRPEHIAYISGLK